MSVFKFATAASVLACAVSMPAYAASMINPDGSVTLESASSPFAWQVITHASAGVFDGNEESTINYNFTGTSGNAYNFTYTLENTSVGDAGGPSVAVFGFNVTPSPTSVLAGGADLFQEGTGGNFNGLSPSIEFCFFAGSNCNGGGNAGLFPGQSTSGSFTINYGSAQSSITLANFATRFQRTGADNEGSASGSGPGIPPGGQPPVVPEPSTWAMMIVGFGLVGTMLRRRRRQAVRLSFA